MNAYVWAWYLILTALGWGPTSVGVTPQQITNAGNNYETSQQLPTVQNINTQAPVVKKSMIKAPVRMAGGRGSER
jgi:hypothetical protein